MNIFTDAMPMGSCDLGPYEAILLGDIEAEGPITYIWALQIAHRDQPGVEVLFTAESSEGTDAILRQLGVGQDAPKEHHFCYFAKDGSHNNLGQMNLSNAGVFLGLAMLTAAELLGVSLSPSWTSSG